MTRCDYTDPRIFDPLPSYLGMQPDSLVSTLFLEVVTNPCGSLTYVGRAIAILGTGQVIPHDEILDT